MPRAKVPLGRRIAADLLSIDAVSLAPDDPFVWASGMRSPIYCDNRLTISYPAVRRAITDGFVALLERHGLRPDVVVGTATAGIPHAAWLAQKLDLPMAYVRSKAKAHGQSRQIEGRVQEGQSAVVVEDLISTGGSSLTAVDAVEQSGVRVLAVLAIFSYGLDEARTRFSDADLVVHTLTDYDTLVDVARQKGGLSTSALHSLTAWREDPVAWDRAQGS